MECGVCRRVCEDLGAGVDAQRDGCLVVTEDDIAAQKPRGVCGEVGVFVVDTGENAGVVGLCGTFGLLAGLRG